MKATARWVTVAGQGCWIVECQAVSWGARGQNLGPTIDAFRKAYAAEVFNGHLR